MQSQLQELMKLRFIAFLLLTAAFNENVSTF